MDDAREDTEIMINNLAPFDLNCIWSSRKQIEVITLPSTRFYEKLMANTQKTHSKNVLSINTHVHMTCTYRTSQLKVDETNELLRKFWKLDAVGIKDSSIRAMTKDETRGRTGI